MTASVFSTLNGKLVGKHPTLGVLVSEDGMVLTLARGSSWGSPIAKFNWNTGTDDSKGYLYLRVRCKNYWIHRLVAETFIPNPLNKPTVDHIDRNPHNNSVQNLKWATQKEQTHNTRTFLNCGIHKCEDPNAYARMKRAQKKKAEQEAQSS